MLQGIEAIIFDMDGTLMDSMWVWPSLDDDFSEKYGFTFPEDFYNEMEGMSFTEVAALFKAKFPVLTQSVEDIMDEWTDMAYQKYTTEVTLKPGILEFLEEMKKRGILLGIATSNGRKLVDASLEFLGITPFFQSIRTSCEVTQGKPAPDVYELVASDLQVEPSKCLVFEDVIAGIQAGKNAGMRVCAIEDDFSAYQREEKRKLADYYIEDYREVLEETYEVLHG